MEKDKHLKNQVLYITNPAYEALHSENLLEENENHDQQERMEQMDFEK